MSTYLEFDYCAVNPAFERPLNRPEKHFPTLSGYLCPDGQEALWSGKEPLPAIGAKVSAQCWNQWISATVTGYFREDGWLGVLVKPEGRIKPTPVNQGHQPQAFHCFGLEVRRA